MQAAPIPPNSKNLFFIRHGERADKYLDQKQTNTLITPNGMDQALKTGIFLAQTLDKQKNPDNQEILILSSPYLRCIQTAYYIIQSLQKSNIKIYNNTIYYTSHLKEWQKKNGETIMTSCQWDKEIEEFKPNFSSNKNFQIKKSSLQQPDNETNS